LEGKQCLTSKRPGGKTQKRKDNKYRKITLVLRQKSSQKDELSKKSHQLLQIKSILTHKIKEKAQYILVINKSNNTTR
jgi:hypothetical protein